SHGLDFPELLTFIVDNSTLRRLRFVTSHPKDFDAKLIQVMAEKEAICNHLHLPVQSGSNRILAAMNRKYSVEHYLNLIVSLRNLIPAISVSTDIIVGFPDEKEADFQATQDLLRQVAYDTAFIFHYQQRQDTAAAELPDNVPLAEKLNRVQRLVDLQNKISTQQMAKLHHRTVEILVEGQSKRGENLMMGRTKTNKIVHYTGSISDVGKELLVHVEEVFPHSARGSARARNSSPSDRDI
ncbi:radical SAM protein, partial [candidate division CSSED10-310 bacterium]